MVQIKDIMSFLRSPIYFPQSHECGCEMNPGPVCRGSADPNHSRKKFALFISPPQWLCHFQNNSPGMSVKWTLHDERYGAL